MTTDRPSETAAGRVHAAFRRMEQASRPEAWISVADEDLLAERAQRLDVRAAAGESLPLAGLLVAVKDNIDVAGLVTTAGCREYAYDPACSAPAVQRLEDAGALVLGKTNMDQFATGLIGTRSPYGAVRHAEAPDRIAGGSSAGSAVAVALGIVDVALGTDTAGSGRVPAAYHGLVGLKPTLGIVPCTGVVPASRSFDAVSIFAKNLALASRAGRIMSGLDNGDPLSRSWPADGRLGLPERPRLAVPRADDLEALVPSYRDAFDQLVGTLDASGIDVDVIDVSSLLDIARLLYDGALVAERYAAFGAFLAQRPPSADPHVLAIVAPAGTLRADVYVHDRELVDRARVAVDELLGPASGLLLPTTVAHPTLEEIEQEPLSLNRRIGTFTNFVNLLDLAAVAIPGGLADGLPFGVTVISRTFDDQLGLDLAAKIGRGQPWSDQEGEILVKDGLDLAVFGAHLSGQPLNPRLRNLGARLIGPVATAPLYRLVRLNTDPPKPGLFQVDAEQGRDIAGELWRLSSGALGQLLSELPEPMTLGPVQLSDGRRVTGYGCTPSAAAAGVDISSYGSWLAYLSSAEGGARR